MLKVVLLGFLKALVGISLVIQWLSLCIPMQGVWSLIPGWEIKILHLCVCVCVCVCVCARARVLSHSVMSDSL